MILDDLIQDVPHFGTLFLHHLLGALDSRYMLVLLELVVDERFEQLQGHLLGDTALVKLELRTDNDNATTGVVHTFTQKVLAEPSLLALEHI